MHVQLQFNVPVGVIVDTDTGEISKVVVWDQDLDTGAPIKAYRDEYITPEHPEFEARLAQESSEVQAIRKRYPSMGISVFHELPLDSAEVAKALGRVRDDEAEWPGWDFGA